MSRIDYKKLKQVLSGMTVPRPNKAGQGTLSGHAAGEPFEKSVYQRLKASYPGKIYKQHEYLNELFLKNPQAGTVKERYALFNSHTVFFLLNRGENATKAWSPQSLFEERQNDTADMLFYSDDYYDLIDVKTRNIGKDAQSPNIISAYKLARTCAYMLDHREFDIFDIHYIEIDWVESNNTLTGTDVHYADLFKANPDTLYINWAAAMQIQFHVCELDQSWNDSREAWARKYLAAFTASAQRRCDKMQAQCITPFQKYNKTKNMITIIAAVADNRAIGNKNELIYRLPADLRRFKELTTGHTIVMGRRTFESLPKGALPDRRNIVLTRTAGYSAPGAEVFGSLDEALAACRPEEEVYVIGGASVYAEALPLADRLCLTHVADKPAEADVFFPDYDAAQWRLTASESHEPDDRHAVPYTFADYERL